MDQMIQKTIQTFPADITLLWDSDFTWIITKFLREARHNIYVSSYKMEPKKGPRAQRVNGLISQLVSAQHRGVDVKILLNFHENKKATSSINWYAAKALKKRGVTSHYFIKDRTMHAKIIIIDNNLTVIGSHNWSVLSQDRNIELSLLVKSPTVNKRLQEMFLHLWEGSRIFPGE